MSIIGIYKIISPSGKLYIGKTKNFENRKKQYQNLKLKNQRKLFYSFQKYGYINHKFEMIEECKYDKLNNREKYWIKKLDSVNKGLNLTWGGDGGIQSKESEELRRLNSILPLYQYDLEGNFIKEFKEGAGEAIKEIGKGNPNNINDCARGKYHSTYGFRWKYKKDVENKNKLPKLKSKDNGIRYLLYKDDKFIKRFKLWKDLTNFGINVHTINKCLKSHNNEFTNSGDNIKYKIMKEYINEK
jgi:group I intron endonuclease